MNRIIRNGLWAAAALWLLCRAAVGAAEDLRPGDPAPAFVAKTYDDADFYLRDYCGEPRGKRYRQERNILVLSFFATWCKPCKEEIPVLQELSTKYKGEGVLFYLVNKGEGRDTVGDFLYERVVTLPVLMDRYEVLAKKYCVRELPTLVVIGKDGRLAEYHTGYHESYQRALAFKLDSLLGKPLPKLQAAAADIAPRPKPKAKGKSVKKNH